jgi:hypothetical protein
VFYTIRTFDSLTLSTITTTRKFFTIIVSVVVHGHVLLSQQWIAVGVVFLGLILEVVDGENEKRKKRLRLHHSSSSDSTAAVPADSAASSVSKDDRERKAASASAISPTAGAAISKPHAR